VNRPRERVSGSFRFPARPRPDHNRRAVRGRGTRRPLVYGPASRRCMRGDRCALAPHHPDDCLLIRLGPEHNAPVEWGTGAGAHRRDNPARSPDRRAGANGETDARHGRACAQEGGRPIEPAASLNPREVLHNTQPEVGARHPRADAVPAEERP